MIALNYSHKADLQTGVEQAIAQFGKGSILIIHGPTGSGKSELARMIHQAVNPGETFVAQDAAGLAENRFESQLYGHVKGAFSGAVSSNPGILGNLGRGTLCLESLEDLTRENQARMLRFLQSFSFRPTGSNVEHRFHGHLIFTARHPAGYLREKRMLRDDFYYRIANFELELPPLHGRAVDFMDLANTMIQRLSKNSGFEMRVPTKDELAALAGVRIDGNLHGLWNLLQQAMITGVSPKVIRSPESDLFYNELPETGSLKSDLEAVEKLLLARALKQNPYSRKELAKHLGISIRSLLYKLKAHGLGREDED